MKNMTVAEKLRYAVNWLNYMDENFNDNFKDANSVIKVWENSNTDIGQTFNQMNMVSMMKMQLQMQSLSMKLLEESTIQFQSNSSRNNIVMSFHFN